MRDRLHTLLCWLLCALLVGAGAPPAAAQQCDAGRREAPCCRQQVAKPCCCPATVVSDCGCERPHRDPPREPTAQKQPLACARAVRLATPTSAVRPAATGAIQRTDAERPNRLLPRRSFQEALSVWRC